MVPLISWRERKYIYIVQCGFCYCDFCWLRSSILSRLYELQKTLSADVRLISEFNTVITFQVRLFLILFHRTVLFASLPLTKGWASPPFLSQLNCSKLGVQCGTQTPLHFLEIRLRLVTHIHHRTTFMLASRKTSKSILRMRLRLDVSSSWQTLSAKLVVKPRILPNRYWCVIHSSKLPGQILPKGCEVRSPNCVQTIYFHMATG